MYITCQKQSCWTNYSGGYIYKWLNYRSPLSTEFVNVKFCDNLWCYGFKHWLPLSLLHAHQYHTIRSVLINEWKRSENICFLVFYLTNDVVHKCTFKYGPNHVFLAWSIYLQLCSLMVLLELLCPLLEILPISEACLCVYFVVVLVFFRQRNSHDVCALAYISAIFLAWL